MKTRTMIWVSAIFWCLMTGYAENTAACAIVVVGHVLFFLGHSIEVKLNKLLDYHRLTVTEEDLDS